MTGRNSTLINKKEPPFTTLVNTKKLNNKPVPTPTISNNTSTLKNNLHSNNSNSNSSIANNNNNNTNINNNRIFQILSKKDRNKFTLQELVNALKLESNVSYLNLNESSLEGSFLHYLTQTAQASDDVSWRMVYALSNAGIDVNIQNDKGNTALHLAYMRGYTEIGFEFIEALLKVGSDLSLKNKNNKIASNYMEDIEQLNSMYDAHYPGIWMAVKESNASNIQRLMNAWVKVNTKKNGLKLMDFAKENCSSDNRIVEILNKYSLPIDYVHSLYSIDLKRIEAIYNLIEKNFDPNMADFGYYFSWYRPFCRNIPKFILEVAFETKEETLIKNVLSTNCDVNLPNTKNGDPFYFYAFETEYQNYKNELLTRISMNMKNQRGQNVLFHIVNLYLKNDTNNDMKKFLIEDFSQMIRKYPLLITQRDQDDLTLIETIISMNPVNYKKSIVFLKEISKLMLKIVQDKNYKVLQEMIYQSYGLILLNTPIYIQPETSDTSSPNSSQPTSEICLTFEDYIIKYNLSDIKIYLKKFFENDFITVINKFASGIKLGDLNLIREVLGNEKNLFLIRIRDYSGRSCLHLAILYGQLAITKFLLQQDGNLIKSLDNLNRTVLHYAYALKDSKSVEILIPFKINKYSRDAKFLIAEEYQLEEVQTDDYFKVKNFKETETKKSTGILTFMKCFQYKKIKQAIEKNDVESLKQINLKLKSYELSLSDFPVLKAENSFIEGQEYVTLLELAMKSKSFSAFRFILEQIYDSFYSTFKDRKTNETVSKNDALSRKSFESYLTDLRELAEDLEIHEVIDILDNTDEDKEIAAVTLERFNTDLSQSVNLNNVIMKRVVKQKVTTLNTFNSLKQTTNNEIQNNKNSHKKIYTINNYNRNLDTEISKNSKLCSIL